MNRDAIVKGLVKPLVWTEAAPKNWVAYPYKVYPIEGVWLLGGTGRPYEHHNTIEAAKSAATADYYAKVTAALDLDKIVALVEALEYVAAGPMEATLMEAWIRGRMADASVALAAFRAAATGGEVG